VEVLVVRRTSGAGIQARRVLLAGREEVARVLGEGEDDKEEEEEGWSVV